VKGKGKALAVDKAEKPAKGKGKGKKAKTKANEENEAPTPVLAVVQDEPPFDAERLPIEPGHPATELAGKYAIEATGGSPEPPTSLPPRGQPPDVAPLAEPVLLATEPLEENVEVEDIPALHVEDESNKLRPVSLAVTAASATTDLSMIAEGEEEISASSARSTGLASQSLQQNPAVNVESQSEDLQDNQPAGDQESSAEPVTASIAVPLESVPAEYDLPPAAPTPIAATPGVPVRQVRSSWLSKALGTGTVPITGLSNGASDNSALRKSFAAPSQRGNAPVDFAALRKSLAPAGGMKRKSDEGMEEEEQETLERRPEKAVKVDFAVMPSVQPAVESISQPAPVLLASIRAPVSSTSLPAGNAPPAIPEAPLSVQNPRSDIHKVTRALDELRERAQAKELAKQRATPKATSTGSGFLRGLGNLGRSLGLGASAKTAEEEAVRLEEERKAELEAQEELERLIGEVSKPVEQVDGIRSTTPDAPLPTPLIEEARVDEVEEEAKVFKKLQEDIEVQSVQVHSPRAVRDIHSARQRTPPRTKRVILGSTTPAGTPPRVLPVAIEAPATHARPEKHVHSSPVKTPKLPTEQHIEQSIDSREAHRPVILETLLGESSVPPLEATAVEDDADTEEQEVEEGEEEEVMEVDARQQPEASVS